MQVTFTDDQADAVRDLVGHALAEVQSSTFGGPVLRASMSDRLRGALVALTPCKGTGRRIDNASGHEIVANVSTCPECGTQVANENMGGFAVRVLAHVA